MFSEEKEICLCFTKSYKEWNMFKYIQEIYTSKMKSRSKMCGIYFETGTISSTNVSITAIIKYKFLNIIATRMFF